MVILGLCAAARPWKPISFFRKRGKKSKQVEHEQAEVNEVERAEQPESQRAAAVTPRSQRSENTTPPCGSRFRCETSVKQQDVTKTEKMKIRGFR